jgi:hypothetical protein
MKIKITSPDGTVMELEAKHGSRIEIGERQAAPLYPIVPYVPITVPVQPWAPQTWPWDSTGGAIWIVDQNSQTWC